MYFFHETFVNIEFSEIQKVICLITYSEKLYENYSEIILIKYLTLGKTEKIIKWKQGNCSTLQKGICEFYLSLRDKQWCALRKNGRVELITVQSHYFSCISTR